MAHGRTRMGALCFLCMVAACPGSETRDTGPSALDAGGGDRGAGDASSAPDRAVPSDAAAPDTSTLVDSSTATDLGTADTAGRDLALADLVAPDATAPPDAAGPDTYDAGPECTDEDGGPGCTEPLTCCSNRCVDRALDPAHCGACGLRCDPARYCAGTTGCTALDFSTLCHNATRYDVRTAATDDNLVLTATADAIAAHCSGTVNHTTLSNATVVNQATYAPLVGIGHLLILHGGPYFQRMTRYFEEQGIAPLRYAYDATNDRDRFVKTDGSGAALDVDALLNTDSHDYFLVELFADPARGALILASYGFKTSGSRAAGWYIVHHLLAAPAPLASWYIVEWTDGDADLAPSSLDAFVLRGSSLD